MQRIVAILAVAAVFAGCAEPSSQTAATEQVRTMPVPAHGETQPSADDDANDVAVWIHPEDPSQSVLLVSAGTAGLESYGLDGQLIARYDRAQIDHIKVAYGFSLKQASRTLLVGYDRQSGGLLSFTIDAASRRIEPVSHRPLVTNTEILGLCLYRSPLTATYYAFASGDDGTLQQWQMFESGGKVDGRLVRTIPVGVGSVYCAVDEAAGQVYVAEESIGIWKFGAEPETDATRHPVTSIAPLGGRIAGQVKGIGLYKVDGERGYLIASDVDAARFNVHSLADAALLGSFSLKKAGGINAVDDAEGLAIASVRLSPELPHGLLAVVDKANEGGANVKLVAWDAIAEALDLENAGGVDPRAPPPASAKTVMPTVETEPVSSYGDAADDPAIWVHPTDPARSLIIGTDKKRGLDVYDLTGKRVQSLEDGRMNNVDLRYGFRLGGREAAIAAATNRTDKTLALYSIDSSSGRMTNVTDGTLPTGFRDPYGLCMYRSAKSGEYFVFANDGEDGTFRQWRLRARNGKVGAEPVREFVVGTQSEGCAADDETGRLYIAEEDAGLWRYSAEPDGGSERVMIDDMRSGNLLDDVEGVAIYRGPNGSGYLLASSQGADNYAVYRREGENEFVGTFHVVADHRLGIDGVSETDGIDVTSAPLGPAFPHGAFVAQDGRNMTPAERQNFKLVPWERIAEALKLPP